MKRFVVGVLVGLVAHELTMVVLEQYAEVQNRKIRWVAVGGRR